MKRSEMKEAFKSWLYYQMNSAVISGMTVAGIAEAEPGNYEVTVHDDSEDNVVFIRVIVREVRD